MHGPDWYPFPVPPKRVRRWRWPESWEVTLLLAYSVQVTAWLLCVWLMTAGGR